MEDITGETITQNGALQALEGILVEMRMGPVDSEVDAIMNIRSAMLRNEITPEEAVQQARTIEQQRASHYR